MRERKTKTRGAEQNSIDSEQESEAAAERKILHVWQSFDQMFGKRWAENFGSDPLGKNDPQNRMELWIETVRYISWPQLKATIQKIRQMPKPETWWLPDLQTFTQLNSRAVSVSHQAPPPRPAGTWVDRACNMYLLRIAVSHGPFNQSSIAKIWEAKEQLTKEYNGYLERGEVPKNPSEEDWQLLRDILTAKLKKLPVEKMTEEEMQQAHNKFMASRFTLLTRENSNSATQTGDWGQDAPSLFDSSNQPKLSSP